MMETLSDYSKRTCLMCGCHTRQTINIYESLTGPNILQLLQTKFKYQPMDHDKYLCFSCNNWFINCYSLQALNLNDSENSSVAIPPHLNKTLQNKMDFITETQRPVAVCKPFNMMNERAANITKPQEFNFVLKERNTLKTAKFDEHRNNNRTVYCNCDRTRKLRIKQKHYFTRRMRRKTSNMMLGRKRNSKHFNLIQNEQTCLQPSEKIDKYLDQSKNQSQTNRAFLKDPLLDGRTVSMLRRIGTTISGEAFELDKNGKVLFRQLPKIMSPIKEKCYWRRILTDNEIPLTFGANISEVLPALRGVLARKQLTYPTTFHDNISGLCDTTTTEVTKVESYKIIALPVNNDKEENVATFNVPKSLSITLV